MTPAADAFGKYPAFYNTSKLFTIHQNRLFYPQNNPLKARARLLLTTSLMLLLDPAPGNTLLHFCSLNSTPCSAASKHSSEMLNSGVVCLITRSL